MARKRELRRSGPIQPEQTRPHDRRPGARYTGNQRQRLAEADSERARQRRAIGVGDHGHGAPRFDDQHDDPARDERARDDSGVLHDIPEEQTRRNRRQECNQHHEREPPSLRIRWQSRDHGHNPGPVQPHDRKDRPELNHDGEGIAGIFEPDEVTGKQQMRRRRNREELREALEDAEQRRDEVCQVWWCGADVVSALAVLRRARFLLFGAAGWRRGRCPAGRRGGRRSGASLLMAQNDGD